MAISASPKITSVEALPIRLPRDIRGATGSAGSPTVLGDSAGGYRWSSTFPTLYSEYIETTLVKITLSDGTHGWGEAQAPLAPRVSATIVTDLLAPVLMGAAFDGTSGRVAEIWNQMYQTMRVRGQTGGFMMDAISGVDIALWDLAGKLRGEPVAALLAEGEPKTSIAAYLSGVTGAGINERTDFAEAHAQRGFQTFKVFFDSEPESLLSLLDTMRGRLGDGSRIAVDALWRLELPGSEEFLAQLESRSLYWFECPFYPDELAPHRELARGFGLPLAVGESYRTCRELEPFFKDRLVLFVQPDLGRSGITETLRIGQRAAELGVALVPHVSVALGPQIAAAIHTAAAIPNCELCEYNPNIFGPSNRYLVDPIEMRGAGYRVPTVSGLGIEVRESELRRDSLGFSD